MAGTALGMWLYTRFKGKVVGSDHFGNRYFRERGGGNVHPDSLRKERRWVVYADEVEASRVPPEWHAWLHHTVTEPPPPGGPARQPWEKEHQRNRTGTGEAYRPPGHTLSGGKRARGTGDYEPWTPE